jgi:hypothetical protein
VWCVCRKRLSTHVATVSAEWSERHCDIKDALADAPLEWLHQNSTGATKAADSIALELKTCGQLLPGAYGWRWSLIHPDMMAVLLSFSKF